MMEHCSLTGEIFCDYLQLEDMGVYTTHGYDPVVPEEKLEELRRFGGEFGIVLRE